MLSANCSSIVPLVWTPLQWCPVQSDHKLFTLPTPRLSPFTREISQLYRELMYLSFGLDLDSILFNLDHELLGVCRGLDQFRLKVLQLLFHHCHLRRDTHTQPFHGSLEFVWDNPGEPVPEETFTHSHSSWSQSSQSAFSIYYDPWHPSYSIHVLYSLFHNLSPSFLWSTSWPGTSTSYCIHFFTQSLSSFRNTCPYHCNLFCCSTEIMSSNPSLLTPTMRQ